MDKSLLKKIILLTMFSLCFLFLNHSNTNGHKGFPLIHEFWTPFGTVKENKYLVLNYLLASTVLALGTIFILRKKHTSQVFILCIFSAFLFLVVYLLGNEREITIKTNNWNRTNEWRVI